MQRISIFTGNLSYSVRKGIAEINECMEDVELLVVVHAPQKPLSQLLKNQWKNTLRHGWRWIPYQLDKIIGLVRNRYARLHPVFCVQPGAKYAFDALKEQPRIDFYCTNNIHSDEAQKKVQDFKPDLGVSLAAPILKPVIFSIPQLGTIDLHKGKVPFYRGMPPAFWELWNNEQHVGCTIHKVDAGLNTGDILLQSEIPVQKYSTLKGLQIEIDELGIKLTCMAIQQLFHGNAVWYPQDSEYGSTYRRPTLKQEQQLLRRYRLRYRDSPIKRFIKDVIFHGYIKLHRLLPRFFLARRNQQNIIVLLYHRVNDELRDSVTVSIEQFDQMMTNIKKYYPIASIENIIAGDLPRNTARPIICVTFDDGYRDNYDYAVPILLKHQIPAAFFVSTGMIGQERGFAHDLDKLGYALPNMTWQQIQQMYQHGFTIGSHTVNHFNCGKGSAEEVHRELLGSKRVLQRELGRNEVIFAYPFGKKTDISPQALEIVKHLGYSACLSAYGGINKGGVDRYNILRTGINYNFTDAAFQAKIEGF